MRKVDDREKKEKEKRMSFIVATNIVASWPPELRLTGTPVARTNCIKTQLTHCIEVRHIRHLEPTGVKYCRRKVSLMIFVQVSRLHWCPHSTYSPEPNNEI